MNWQDAMVLAVVTGAVWALYARARGMFATGTKNGGSSSCHGCDDCGED